MAKAKSSKSAEIRAALTANPTKPVSEIAKDFGVTPNYVYKLKTRMNKPKKTKSKPGRKPGRKPSVGAAPQSAHVALDSAFEFVTKVGGLLHAEALIAKLRDFKDRL